MIKSIGIYSRMRGYGRTLEGNAAVRMSRSANASVFWGRHDDLPHIGVKVKAPLTPRRSVNRCIQTKLTKCLNLHAVETPAPTGLHSGKDERVVFRTPKTLQQIQDGGRPLFRETRQFLNDRFSNC